MKPWSERFAEAVAALDEETLARLDAAIQARRDAPDRVPDDDPWAGQGPDPFGMDWQWAEPSESESTAQPRPKAEPPQILPFPKRDGIRSRFRRIGYGVGVAAAASLLVGLGLLIASRLPRGMEILVATATPVYGSVRGAERELGVDIRTDLTGFATIIAIAEDGRYEVLPGIGTDDIDVPLTNPYGPLPSWTSRALVVVTETPAADPVRRALDKHAFKPDQILGLRDYLRETLQTKGYRRMAFDSTTFTPAEPRR